MISPVFADVFVPPGPTNPTVGNPSEWITPTLAAFTWSGTKASTVPIGWTYTDGPTYNALTEMASAQIPAEDPAVYTTSGLSTASSSLATATTMIPYGQQVIVVGFVPGVTVAVDQVPPPVELQITWNGVPNTVTLSVPASQVVGVNYPPTMYPSISTPYQFAYPASTGTKTPAQMASYNLWVGNYAQVLKAIWGTTVAPSWWNKVYGSSDVTTNGEWFWYTYTPNAGDFVSLDSNGQVSTPATYSITAMFEYGTSQIWFNHVDFNVVELMTHKDVSWCTSQIINDVINITNVGLVTATGLDIQQTYPEGGKILESPTSGGIQVVSYDTKGNVVPVTGTMQLTPAMLYSIQVPSDLVISTANGFPAAYTTLATGQSLIITLEISVSNVGSWTGTIVWDSMTSCTQIAPWKDPIAIAALWYPMGTMPSGSTTALWTGLYLGDSKLFGEMTGHIDFDTISAIGGVTSNVQGSVLRTPLMEAPMAMTLDPTPVPLIAGETSVTQADVALVRNMVLGLAPYDQRADCNGNGKIDVQDLSEYIAAA